MDHSDREVSDFLLRACHDLRAPARAVRTYSELLAKDSAPRGDSFAQRLGFILEGSSRIDLLVDGLVKYSLALQTDAASFQSARMDVLLRQVLMKLDRELRDCGAEVTYSELPVVTGNPDRLMQVLENLLRNGLIHRGVVAPRIHIAADRQESDWLFTVRDNGPGVETAFLENIFLPFEQPQGNQRTGVGLGLTICRGIVNRHGGRIWAEPQTGGGAALCFTLPAQ